jgi:Ferritin-like
MNTGARTNSAGNRPEDAAKIAKREADRRRQRDEEDRLSTKYKKRRDMTWRDHLLMLLSFGATVEHCLMVQYLYAAYSLRTDEPNKRRREMIEHWRASILAVAKEEMGHLLTVQNLRRLLGSTVEIGRDSSPWARQYYPYPFTLEPFSLLSLSCFVYAEAPAFTASKGDFPDPERDLVKDEILPTLRARFGSEFEAEVHRVGRLYEEIIDLISNRERIPDEMFDESSYEFQASWDEWGRGYRAAPRQLDAEGNLADDKKKPDDDEPKPWHDKRKPRDDGIVQIDRMATRADAIKALQALAAQGEAPHLRNPLLPDSEDEISHFDRFLRIYRQFKEEGQRDPGWLPAAGIPANPTTRTEFVSATAAPTGFGLDAQSVPGQAGAQAGAPVGAQAAAQAGGQVSYTLVDSISARHLADLFNQRYRLLLNYLAHSFRISRSQRVDRPNLRAMIMHRVFGEMYNLKTISGLLVRLPRRDDGNEDERAAPPFELPYSLNLPDSDADMWRRHENLIASSQDTCKRLLYDTSPSTAKHPEHAAKVQQELARTGADLYLRTLLQLDDQARAWMNKIIAGEA